MGVKKMASGLLPKRLKRFIKENAKPASLHDEFINLSFSQEGEDLILQRIFENKSKGFYVDIGAHHPFRFSNTYKFYLKGWNGINIDPLPGSMNSFKQARPRDINLEIPILNDAEKEVFYYMFDEPALNSLNEKHALDLETSTTYKIINKLKLKPYRLEDVFNTYLPLCTSIDFMSVDVEGMDLEVLQSNNWDKYRPKYIIAESISSELKKDFDSPLSQFLSLHKYLLIGKTVNSLFFKCN